MADLGIDFASTDGTTPPDLTKAHAAGMRIGIPRGVFGRPVQGSAGKPFRDPCWELNKDRFGPAGMKCTAYLFLCLPTKKAPTCPSPEEQADAMFQYVTLDPKVHYPVVIDVEQDSDAMTKAEKLAWYNRGTARLAELYGCLPIVYTSNRVWNEVLGNPTKEAAGLLGQCIPWLAKPWPWATRTPIHLDGAPAYSPTPIRALGDKTFWLWYQYQGDAIKMPGFAGAVDANRPQGVVKRGSKGTIVAFLQRLLGVTADGDFGPITEEAVKAYQASEGLAADGLVYIATWQRLLWRNQPC